MVWEPGDPWPSPTIGGATSPAWGGYVRLFVRASIASGTPWTLGQHNFDRLDDGNVMAGAEVERAAAGAYRLWVDLACDAVDVSISGGSSSAQGIFSKPDASTCQITIADPDGIYDPLNPSGPFSFGGHSRLVPGTPVEVFAEVVTNPTSTPPLVESFPMFTGTADSWQQDWTPHPWDRQTILVATDPTKTFVRFNRPEVGAQGGGDTIGQRVHRIVDYFGWQGTVIDPPGGSPRTLAATTLATSAWELLNRAWDDELGFGYFTEAGALRWVNRETWFTLTPPVVVFGCELAGAMDVLLDATPTALDRQMRNAVHAARTGGTTRSEVSQASVDRFGVYEYTRTDLGLNDDTQVGRWVTDVLTLYAFPQVTLTDVTFRLSLHPESWESYAAGLGVELLTDIVHIHWTPPDRPTYVVDNYSRVVGYSHTITRHAWETKWQLAAAQAMQFAGVVFTMGPHANDRLDAGFVMGFAA